MATGVAIAGLVYGNHQSSQARGDQRRQAEAAAAAAEARIPKNINVSFPTGDFSFIGDGKGGFNSSLNAGLSVAHAPIVRATTIDPSLIEQQDFSVLDSITKQFDSIGQKFNQLDDNVDDLRGVFNDAGDLKSLVAPGASKLRQSRLSQIDNAASKRTGNLRDSLSRRRIAGSSFAEDALSRTEAEFAQQRSDAEAKTILEEIEATTQILTFQSEVVTRAASIINAKLTGQFNTAQASGQNEQFKLNTQQDANIFNATQEQNANIFNANAKNQASLANAANAIAVAGININAEIAAMNAAFGLTQAALSATTGLSSSLTAANNAVIGSISDHGDDQQEIIGSAVGLFGSQIGTSSGSTSSGGGQDITFPNN